MTGPPTSATERVLVVDDEVIIATTLSIILVRNGFESQYALSAEEAVRAAHEFLPDVLLTDLIMPNGKDGVELIREVRQFLPGCRALLITGQASFLLKAPEFENLHVIEKPIQPADLIAILRGHDIPMGPARPMTVLLVEDQDIKRYSVARWLKHNGIEVREAGSGAEALERAREPVDCVLLDVDLPDMDGYRVCRKLREASLNTTVIHYTASCCDPLAEQESIRAGADAFIPQPIEPEQLLYDIRNYVQLRYLQNEVRPV